ncbi:hypothetical protein ACHAWO_009247 [Cyclotella atomus]|uniref:F-box domain-containing protein n=1 Tax=Cyclotella atomus TaxID=382360 RepID=A0ABD3Q3Q9_9STRA
MILKHWLVGDDVGCAVDAGVSFARTKADEVSEVSAALSDPDLLSSILSFLSWKELLRCRVCRTWRQAVALTNVPESISDVWSTPDLYINSREFVDALGWLSKALPRVPCVNIRFNLYSTKPFEIAACDDPELPSDSSIASPSNQASLRCIADFLYLKHISITSASLNGSHPYLFDFPELRTLELVDVGMLVWNLDMLQNLRKLEQLIAVRNTHLTGRLGSIRVLRESLVKLSLVSCFKVGGDLLDLRDFPLLKDICLNDCNRIGGDIREVQIGDFQSVESFGRLPNSVFGGSYLPSIADTPAIMRSWYILKKQNPSVLTPSNNGICRLSLSMLSTERYENDVHHTRYMPTCVEFISAGTRLGWRWTNAVRGGSCETIWMDPAPQRSDPGYDLYLLELEKVNEDVVFYKGFFAPPSQDEHLQRNNDMPFLRV